MYIPLLGMDVYSGMCFMFSECHGVSRHETVFQQPLLVDHTQIYFASSLQRVLRGACRRRRRKKNDTANAKTFCARIREEKIDCRKQNWGGAVRLLATLVPM